MAKRGESYTTNGIQTIPQATLATGLMASDPNNGRRINVQAGPAKLPPELQIGSYVFANGHIRKVQGFYPNETAFRIDEPFPFTLTFNPLLMLRPGRFRKISVFNASSSVTGVIQDGAYIDRPIPPRTGFEWKHPQGLEPLVVNTQGADFIIVTTEV